mmetsp:Transcript_22493/g.40601  ORF Transcript_22493/g.40601 Transcript_22493/m.40601 type:complete len:212 (+) Transcript_22493:684-1319(+)
MWQGVAFVDWHSVRDAITAVHDDAGCAARSIQGENGLDRHVHGWDREGFEHDLCHAFAICLGVHGRLGEEHWVFLWQAAELIVEGMVPNLLHAVPIFNYVAMDGVHQIRYATPCLDRIAHAEVLTVCAPHDEWHARQSNHGREQTARSVLTRKSDLTHAAANVQHHNTIFFFLHAVLLVLGTATGHLFRVLRFHNVAQSDVDGWQAALCGA